MKEGDPVPVEPRSLTAGNAVRLRALDILALPLFDKSALHLRNHAEYRHHDAPDLASRRNVRVQHLYESLALLAFANEVQDVPRVAPVPSNDYD